MAVRTQIELSKENIKKLEGIKKKCRFQVSLTSLANEAVDAGWQKVLENFDKIGVLETTTK